MGDIRKQRPVLLMLAAFSRYAEALEWGRETACSEFGPLALCSDPFEFLETTYYEKTMGRGIRKQFWAFSELVDPGRLPGIKLRTNGWEQAYRQDTHWPESRPLNLDPGYLTEAKLVLATTKDRDHRLYLDQGIFAEGTLFFHGGQWCPREWTYPDYQRSDYHRFFVRCRNYLRERYRSGSNMTDA